MSHQVFVYGTLKQGFRNFHINHGRRLPGEFVTVQPHVLLIVGDCWLPWLLEESRANSGPREGLRVVGQIYEVDEAGLAAMDRLEQIDEAGWYQRKRVEVKPRGQDDASALLPWVYFGSREGLARERKHLGPVAEFTEAHQDLLPRHLWPQS